MSWLLLIVLLWTLGCMYLSEWECLSFPSNMLRSGIAGSYGSSFISLSLYSVLHRCSVSQSCPALCNPMDYSAPGFLVHHLLPEFTQTHVHWVDDAMQPSYPRRPLLLPPSVIPSNRVFSNESVLRIRWPKYWSFSFSISPCNEHSGLISFGMDWLDLLAVQGTLSSLPTPTPRRSLLQHHSSKASVLQHPAFFIVQLSHPYMSTGKTIALTRQTFVGKVMSLLFNKLFRLVITILPRNERLLISCL